MFDHARQALQHVLSPETRHVIGVTIDTISVSAVIATLIGLLPGATAILTFLWACIRIYETKTVQKWIHGKSPENN